MPTLVKETKIRQTIQLDYPAPRMEPVKVVRLQKAALTDEDCDQLAGHSLEDNAYDVLFDGDCDIYKPDGSLLARLRQRVLPEDMCERAFPVWADAAFMALAPRRHHAQMRYVRKTSPDFTIHGTAFTTVTVNRNFQTAVRKDVGDLRQGFGVMSALRRGRFS